MLAALLLSACAAHETTEPAQATVQPLPAPPPAPPPAVASAAPAPAEQATRVLPDGLEIQDLRVGAGDELKPGCTAVVHYVGTLTDGTEFDSSRRRNTPFTARFPGPFIKGWNEGVPGMRVGGLRRLVIPPSLAYGDKAFPRIPPGSTLVFEVELLEVRPAP